MEFTGLVHENIGESLKGRNFQRFKLDISLIRDGYNPNYVNQLEKKKRNLLLLEKMLEKEPNNYITKLYYGREVAILDTAVALEYLNDVLLNSQDLEIKEKAKEYIHLIKDKK
ncbi:hypothetical protein ACFSCX_09280 [Bacillus salitolerans]|uniref:Uncharacterized protein n=1 Tax=Bacillus salitolerans TaxID=1437434 RepID=A0ABW4LNX7_9BACI